MELEGEPITGSMLPLLVNMFTECLNDSSSQALNPKSIVEQAKAAEAERKRAKAEEKDRAKRSEVDEVVRVAKVAKANMTTKAAMAKASELSKMLRDAEVRDRARQYLADRDV